MAAQSGRNISQRVKELKDLIGAKKERNSGKSRILVVGADDVGDTLLDSLISSVREIVEVRDLRPRIDPGLGYARIGWEVARSVVDGSAWRGLLVCGTGIGVCIAANNVHGARAAVCHDVYSTRRSILSNDCQIICFGSRVVAVEYADVLLREWINLKFDPTGKSAQKIAELNGPTSGP